MESSTEVKLEAEVKKAPVAKKVANKRSKNSYAVSNIQLKRKGAVKGTVEYDFFEKMDQLGEELSNMPEKLSMSGTQLVMEVFVNFKADKGFFDHLKQKYECKITRANMWLKGYNIYQESKGFPPVKMTEFQVDVQPNLKKSDYDRFMKLAQEMKIECSGKIQ